VRYLQRMTAIAAMITAVVVLYLTGCQNSTDSTVFIPPVTYPVSIEYYWVNQHGSLVTTSGGAVTIAAGATLTITAQSTGYTVVRWHLDGVDTGQRGNTYEFSSMAIGKHTVGLLVSKDGKLYNTTIIITVL